MSIRTADPVALLNVAGAGMRVPLVGGGSARAVDLDLAATAPALESVARFVAEVQPQLGSVHRGAGWPAHVATAAFDHARGVVGRAVGSRPDDAVVFTRGTTDALNLLAAAVPSETVVLDVEHHANLLPWQASGHGVRVVPAAATIAGSLDALAGELVRRPAALLAVTGASNVTGELLPIARLARLAHDHGARLAVDGAQLVPHRRVDLAASGADYLAFSGHKAYAPYGSGALVGRGDWLDGAQPFLAGGGAVRRVRLSADGPEAEWVDGPARHEAGTPNVLGALALAHALEALTALDDADRIAHDRALGQRLRAGLARIDGVRVLSAFADAPDAVGVVAFTVADLDPRLVALALAAEWGIAIRDGGFCAHPLLDRLTRGRPALRASTGIGSTAADVDALLTALAAIMRHGPRGRYRHDAGGWAVADDDRPLPAWAGGAAAGGCGYAA